MILDYNYSRENKEMSISYIDKDGSKKLMKFQGLKLFNTYYYDPNGKYDTWNDCKASRKFTANPNLFDLKEFIYTLKPEYQQLINSKVFPKVYTFDIETKLNPNGEFTNPQVADMPILTISVVNPDLNCIVLGLESLTPEQEKSIQGRFEEYLNNISFYKTLSLKETPKFKYIKFDTEEKMIRYFLQTIVAKVPVIAGWNSIGYDWCYFVHRVKNFYPDLSIKISSCTQTLSYKSYTNKRGETIKLPHPTHTLVLDMMEVIEQNDATVMDSKDSMNLDYVAYTTLGANKVEYSGSLQDLFEKDYETYVFYNAIDSILVQLIDKRFKTLNQFYLMSQFCVESIGKCFSKIALTEALIAKHYFDNNIKVVYENNENIDRGQLVGAYVKVPTPGKWEWMCCNDFASLYPSTMMTCNISFDNYLGKIGREFTEEEGEKFKKDRNYFVSVNNNVYKNDKDYTLKVIEKWLKETRNVNKYLAKEIDATLALDIEHLLGNRKVEFRKYSDRVVENVKGLGYDIKTSDDLLKIENKDELYRIVHDEILYLGGLEYAVKILMNSIYGGSSHVKFYFFNMDFANDVTGESRWLIHKMEEHIPKYFNENWLSMKDLHKELGITVREDKVKELKADGKDIVTLVYGDSCSGDTRIATRNGDITIEELFNKSSQVFKDRGKDFGIIDEDIINFDGVEEIYSKIKWVIRHKTNKPKWQITSESGKMVEVTGDHSCIIWKDDKMVEVKPSEIKIGDKVITLGEIIEDIIKVECIGNYDNEYVYDIEVKTNNLDEHNFYGNGILIHNTDSVAGSSIIKTDSGEKTIEQLFLENENNNKKVTQKGHELVDVNDKILNYNTDGELEYQNARYIMRHKVKKAKWRLKTTTGKEIFVTNDHSMIVFRDGKKLEVKPYEILKTDKILVVKMLPTYIFDDIEIIECVGEFEDEYVYDIEMEDDTHTFIANDILVHNSLYSSYANLLETVEGIENMSLRQKLDIVVGINQKHLDEHNCEYIEDLYRPRFGVSHHKFELETVAKAGVWLNVKKRYGQLLMWKDGKYFDEDELPVKVKGLEVIKTSYPALARKINKEFLRFLLEYDGKYLSQELNLLNQKYLKEFEVADIEKICANIRVNKYTQHVLDDRDPKGIKYTTGASYNSKALAMYNWLNNIHKFGEEPIYGGKVKCYTMQGSNLKNGDIYFAFESMKYPKWAETYAPVDRVRMYDKYVLDPINRILEAIHMPLLNSDGSIQLNLF